MARPDPIPNSAVKHRIADGSACIACARVGSRRTFPKPDSFGVRLFYFKLGYFKLNSPCRILQLFGSSAFSREEKPIESRSVGIQRQHHRFSVDFRSCSIGGIAFDPFHIINSCGIAHGDQTKSNSCGIRSPDLKRKQPCPPTNTFV